MGIFNREPRRVQPDVVLPKREVLQTAPPGAYPPAIDRYLDQMEAALRGSRNGVTYRQRAFVGSKPQNYERRLVESMQGMRAHRYFNYSWKQSHRRQIVSLDDPITNARWYVTTYIDGLPHKANIQDAIIEFNSLVQSQRALGRPEAEMIQRRTLNLRDGRGVSIIVPDFGENAMYVVDRWITQGAHPDMAPILPAEFSALFEAGLQLDPMIHDFVTFNNIAIGPEGRLSFFDLTPGDGVHTCGKQTYTKVMSENAALARLHFADLPPEIQDYRRRAG